MLLVNSKEHNIIITATFIVFQIQNCFALAQESKTFIYCFTSFMINFN